MRTLSLDYQAVLASLDHPLDAAEVGAALLSALGDLCALKHQESALHEFEQSGATYLFDLASPADLPQEDRTVAAWALTPAAVAKRASSYQRGFPLWPHASATEKALVGVKPAQGRWTSASRQPKAGARCGLRARATRGRVSTQIRYPGGSDLRRGVMSGWRIGVVLAVVMSLSLRKECDRSLDPQGARRRMRRGRAEGRRHRSCESDSCLWRGAA